VETIGRKYNSKWWTDDEIDEILGKIKAFVERARYNHFTTDDIAKLANLGSIRHPAPQSPGTSTRAKKLQSLIRVLMTKKLIESLGSSGSLKEGTHYCRVGE